jgi:hypothetical protein
VTGSVVNRCCRPPAAAVAFHVVNTNALIQRRAFPTFHIYRGGRVVGQVQGADRGGLRSLIDSEARLLAPLEGAPCCARVTPVALHPSRSSSLRHDCVGRKRCT